MTKNWKERLGTVYSTNPDFNYSIQGDEEAETLPKEKQWLYVSLDSK